MTCSWIVANGPSPPPVRLITSSPSPLGARSRVRPWPIQYPAAHVGGFTAGRMGLPAVIAADEEPFEPDEEQPPRTRAGTTQLTITGYTPAHLRIKSPHARLLRSGWP